MTDHLPDSLHDVVTVLRAEVAPTDRFHRELQRSIANAPPPLRQHLKVPKRGWTIRPAMALAAALAFMVAGGAVTLGVQQLGTIGMSDMPPVVAEDPTSLRAVLRPAAFDDATIGVRFAVIASGARRVSVVGDFNGWDALATPLERSADGMTWTATLPLSAGRHTYAFVIDGEVVADPAASRAPEDDFGTPSSLVLVSTRP